MKLSVLIPMYNEKNIVESTAKTLTEYLEPKFGDDYEIVFSDDGLIYYTEDHYKSFELLYGEP